MDSHKFLPVSREDMNLRGWHYLDILLITGDAYVDHPSFGAAIIGRLLESKGYKVGIIAQPNWQGTEDFKALGKPRLAVLITAGNLDSMVNHYTAAKKPRDKDAYSPGGRPGLRPDRATLVYAQRAREAFKDKPVIIGGIEASLRRFAHYDYWSNKVRRSVLVDSKADLLVYGMGERQVVEIADALKQGRTVGELTDIRGTAYLRESPDGLQGCRIIPGYEEAAADKVKYAQAFMAQYEEQDPYRGKPIVQPHGDKYLVQNPPALPLSQKELDAVYSLPYRRTYHPIYSDAGGVPAIEEVEFSLTSQRGCFGSCSFCALTFHQGRIIQSRSHQSLMAEANQIVWLPNFKGYIHDVGGPTANFRNPACKKQLTRGACRDKQCLYPEPCPNIEVDHRDYVSLLRKLRQIPRVKKVFVRSGIRYDYLLADKSEEFLRELCQHHISGQLKVAPEHVSPRVLARMGKPGRKVFDRFVERYKSINKEIAKQQYLVPYFMSSHPGSTLRDAVELAEYIRDMGYNPEQVQDFIPTPGSLSTCMFYTGLDPRTMEKLHVPRTPKEKAMQRALLQYRNPKNYDLVHEALILAGREDLIGYGKHCLIKPKPAQGKTSQGVTRKGRNGPAQDAAKQGRKAGRGRRVKP
ncbi:MAG: YgiQ family radical SAM protein [Clostridia bacterium]|nr:YgiQ family radical SAM protein [Clostridia bacterium]